MSRVRKTKHVKCDIGRLKMVVFQKLKLQQVINLSNCTQIKDMYTNVVTCVRACDGESDAFPIKIGLHQKSVLNQYIFTSVMNEITNDIKGDIFWCILFADDVVLIDESRIGVDQKLELWRQIL
jgi:hypothetical protein